jgi:hypothetical protein
MSIPGRWKGSEPTFRQREDRFTHPNFARFLVRAAYSGTPAFTHAGEVLAKKHGDEFMREMDRLILAGDDAGLEALAKEVRGRVFDAVMRANARGIDFEQQPATIAMLREQRERFGTALKNLDAATTTKTDEIMRVWDAAHAEDSLHDVIANIRAIDSQAANALINGTARTDNFRHQQRPDHHSPCSGLCGPPWPDRILCQAQGSFLAICLFDKGYEEGHGGARSVRSEIR